MLLLKAIIPNQPSMAENLDEVAPVADIVAPTTEEAETPETPIEGEPVEEKELTDEEIQEEINRLKEEVQKEEDMKEKRHKEQDIGWKQKILKERDKAKALEKENSIKEESLKRYEMSLVAEAYSKIIDDNFGLPYLENLAKTNPDIADRVAQEKWGKKNAKELILDTKRTLAQGGDEESKKHVTEEEIRAKVYHEVAVEQAQTMFDDLEASEKDEAKQYFDEMAEGKTLTPAKAKQFAEMARLYSIRNRKPAEKPVDKDRIIAGKASTGITPKSGNKEVEAGDIKAIRTQLLNAGIQEYQVNLMYPLN